MSHDLFEWMGELGPSSPEPVAEGAEGAVVLRAFALRDAPHLLAAIDRIAAAAPFRHLVTPGGFRMSAAMTNCGSRGWVTDERGYRYQETDPLSATAWPPMPTELSAFAVRAAEAAGYPGFAPDACLINRYEPGARMTLHQDSTEADFSQPIVSVSLGLPASFQFGGLRRTDPVRRLPLRHGDVVVWGGPSRLFHHGILPVKAGFHPATGGCRLNLTFRTAGPIP